MRALVIATALVVAGGCSFALTRSRPAPPGSRTSMACTSYVPAIVDTAVTSVLVFYAVKTQVERDCPEDGCHTFDETPLYALPGLVFGVSAIYGWVADRACRAAR